MMPFSGHSRSGDRPGIRHSSLSSLDSPSSRAALSPYVDLEMSPYPQQAEIPPVDTNPVADLIPNEVYELLLANDLINEKGVRDYIIRRAFKAMREQQDLKSCEALERLQAIYPYLQVDTIRKIIYRIGPGAHRKMML